MTTQFLVNADKATRRLTLYHLGWGVAVMCITQIQGYLPNLDFLDSKQLKIASFVLAVTLTVAKGIEMFFQQAVNIEQADDPGQLSTDVSLPDKPQNPTMKGPT